MIRHVVMWKFRAGAEAQADAFLDGLRGLYGVIPQLRRCEVGKNVVDGNYDAVLIAECDTLEDLNAYQTDPRHQAVVALCKPICVSRVAVDYAV